MNENRNKALNERIKNLRMIRTSAVIRNPLLLEAVGLCPVVAIASTLKSAVFLALVTALELIVCEVIASKFLKNVKRYLRVPVYFLIGTVIVYPIMYLVKRFVPSLSLEFGVFLPLMAVNSLLALHCERVAVKRTVKDSFLDAVSVAVSYGAVTVFAGFFREILGNGTLGGADLHLPVTFSLMLTPFGGLLVLGFCAALLKAYIYKKYPQSSPDRAFNTSEVRRSLHGSLRELMNDDFNPYDEGEDGTASNDADTVIRYERKKVSKPKKTKQEKAKKGKFKQKKPKTETKNKDKNKDETTKNEKLRETLNKIEMQERTYLDDFSDMLTDLENYKQKEENSDEKGGDGE